MITSFFRWQKVEPFVYELISYYCMGFIGYKKSLLYENSSSIRLSIKNSLFITNKFENTINLGLCKKDVFFCNINEGI